jgi:hypothetical protein
MIFVQSGRTRSLSHLYAKDAIMSVKLAKITVIVSLVIQL